MGSAQFSSACGVAENWSTKPELPAQYVNSLETAAKHMLHKFSLAQSPRFSKYSSPGLAPIRRVLTLHPQISPEIQDDLGRNSMECISRRL